MVGIGIRCAVSFRDCTLHEKLEDFDPDVSTLKRESLPVESFLRGELLVLDDDHRLQKMANRYILYIVNGGENFENQIST